MRTNELTANQGFIQLEDNVVRTVEAFQSEMFTAFNELVPEGSDQTVLYTQSAVNPRDVNAVTFRSIDPAVGEQTIFYTPASFILRKVNTVLTGTGNTTFTLYHGEDRNAEGIEIATVDCSNTSTGNVVTALDHSVIPKNHWVWADVTEVNGVVDELTVVLFF